MALTLNDNARNAMVNGFTTLLNGGTIVLKNAASTIRVTINLPASFDGAAAGVEDLTQGSARTGTPSANDTITQGALRQSDTTEIATFSVTDTGGSGDLQLNDGVNDGGGAAVTTNDTVSISSPANFTMPAS